MGVFAQHPHDDPARSIFCNRTLNLRSIRAVGFDMDYTLIEYNVMAWEGKAYEYGAPPSERISWIGFHIPTRSLPQHGCVATGNICPTHAAWWPRSACRRRSFRLRATLANTHTPTPLLCRPVCLTAHMAANMALDIFHRQPQVVAY